MLVLALMTLAANIAGAKGGDDFLGEWALQDESMTIRIVKEGGLYFVIEFVRIKHELFLSGDGTRALFIEYGKGPGWDTTMLKLDGDTIVDMYFSENYTWEPSQYVYYRKR
jgi:hypothetical protein